MPSHHAGTEDERRALDMFIKLSRGSDCFMNHIAEKISALGMNPTQFGVMETLFHLGKLQPSQLAEKHLKSRNNLTVVIDHLEKRGWIQRIHCSRDRRAQWIELTDAGRQVIEATFPCIAAAVVERASVLTAPEQVQLARLMKKLGTGS